MVKRHLDGYIQNSVPLRTVNITQGKLRSDPWMVGKRSPIKEKKGLCMKSALRREFNDTTTVSQKGQKTNGNQKT